MLRRGFLSAFSITTAGAFVLPGEGARAMSLEPRTQHPRASLDAANTGGLDWDLLAQAGETRFVDGRMSRFPAALRALNGREVSLLGYMMPFTEATAHREFLLGALQFHCSGCMMGDLARLVAVKASESVKATDAPVLVRGRLHLIEQDQSPLFYRLENARPV